MPNRFEEAQAKINTFLEQHPEAEWGEAHVVLSDYNLEDHYIMSAIMRITETYWGTPIDDPGNENDVALVRFLASLLDIPEDERCPERGDE